MKKSILTVGLLSLVMILTSFTSTEKVTSTNDSKSEVFKIENTKLDLAGNGGTGGNKKVD